MKAIDRLYEYLEYKTIKPTTFEKNIGFSSGYLSVQRKRNADLGESVLGKINDYCHDLDIYWLLTGEGEMLKTQSKEYIAPEVSSVVSETKACYNDHYKDRLIKQLEVTNKQLLTQINNLEKELINKQTIINGFLNGNITITPHTTELKKNNGR